MKIGVEPVFWIYLLTGLITVISTATVVGVIVATQRRQVEQSRRFSQGLVEAQDAERARIARELHDDVIQRIALIGGELSALGRMIPNQSDAIAQRIVGLREELNDLAEEVRNMARRAHPAILDHLGLPKALQSLATDFHVSDSLEVEFVHDPTQRLDRAAPAAALALFRVAQEGLRNVARHSGTHTARVTLAEQDDGLAVTIEDRGKGMDATTNAGKGLGLLGLTERLRAVQGQLSVASVPGEGTRVTAWVPSQAKETPQ
jgi:signal transduction histidine kinase